MDEPLSGTCVGERRLVDSVTFYIPWRVFREAGINLKPQQLARDHNLYMFGLESPRNYHAAILCRVPNEIPTHHIGETKAGFNRFLRSYVLKTHVKIKLNLRTNLFKKPLLR